MKHKQTGFTIVELLIVIVVIGILAAISAGAYNGMQARARDSIRMSDLANIKKAINVYHIDNGTWVEGASGCGYNGDGMGWFNYVNGTSYPKSVSRCLIEGGYLQNDILDPTKGVTSSPSTGYAYMKYHCGTGDAQRVYIYAKLETRPQSTTATDGTCAGSVDELYGMNYYLQIK